MDLKTQSLKFHSKFRGKLATLVTPSIKNVKDLTLAYTPGVAEVSKVITEDKDKVYDYTIKSHTVAVVSDGSAVLGLGNVGPEAAIPIMEGKAALFKTFAGLDAFPICLATQNSSEIIQIVKAIAPVFGGINLEDISAPRCFEIEGALQDLGIPVMHDDQHGTAVVVLAGLINAAKVVNKNLKNLKVVILGAGAAGTGITRLLYNKVGDILLVDIGGIISRKDKDLDNHKRKLSKITNKKNITGTLQDALKGADVFVGVSKGNLLFHGDIKLMGERPIVFAMANLTPEIARDEAKKGGAYIIATGRSDLPNQVNNSLAFPGVFKGALGVRAPRITDNMKFAAALALANLVKNPTVDKFISGAFDQGVTEAVSSAVSQAA